MDMEPALETFSADAQRLEREIAKVVVGQARAVREVLLALLSGGHVLLEGAPGLGKTLLVKTIARALDLHYTRIQFTPDLMPADVTGTQVMHEDGAGRRFEFEKGPIFGQVVLADEINRATPKTQSALLEAMEEGAVTVAGRNHALDQPFFVLATQNPIEMEGTYPLPEAQLDRFFFKVVVDAPDEDELIAILEATTGGGGASVEAVLDGPRLLELRAMAQRVPIAVPLMRHVARLVQSSGPDGAATARRYVRHGAGVRAGQTLVRAAKARALLEGRGHVDFADIEAVWAPALRHRILLNFEGEAEGITPDAILRDVLAATPTMPGSIQSLGDSGIDSGIGASAEADAAGDPQH